jgi:hypothetical protein
MPNTNFSPHIGVYIGDQVTRLSECGYVAYSADVTQLSFFAAAGGTYYIRVDSNPGKTGSNILSLEFNVPVVSVIAVDWNASETGPESRAFTLIRSGGDLNAPLTIDFKLGGAINGNQWYRL